MRKNNNTTENESQKGLNGHDRRDFLKKTGALAAGLILVPNLLQAGPFSARKSIQDTDDLLNEMNMKTIPKPKSYKVITTEEHFIVREISAQVMAFRQREGRVSPGMKTIQRDLMEIVLPTNDNIEDIAERRIRFMDEAGIDMQVLSYGGNSPQNISDKALAVQLCMKANNALAGAINANPKRFSGFAVLPVVDPIAASAELERSVNELGLKGAMISGTLDGIFFDDPMFLPIFQKAASLGVPIYMHPAIIDHKVSEYYYQSKEWSGVAAAMFATAGYGWHMDSGIAIIRMIISGLFEKLPDLQLISGHWGEMVPFYLNRLDDQLGKTIALERKISDYYRNNVYITPAGLFSEAQLQYSISELGADRILYSGDYPFLIDKNTRGFLDNALISESDKQKIAHENAERLLKLN